MRAVPIPHTDFANYSLGRVRGTASVTKQHRDYSPSPTFLCMFQLCLTLLLASGSHSSLKSKDIYGKHVPGPIFFFILFSHRGRWKVQATDQCFLFPFPRVHLSLVPVCSCRLRSLPSSSPALSGSVMQLRGATS